MFEHVVRELVGALSDRAEYVEFRAQNGSWVRVKVCHGHQWFRWQVGSTHQFVDARDAARHIVGLLGTSPPVSLEERQHASLLNAEFSAREAERLAHKRDQIVTKWCRQYMEAAILDERRKAAAAFSQFLELTTV